MDKIHIALTLHLVEEKLKRLNKKKDPNFMTEIMKKNLESYRDLLETWAKAE